MRNPLATMHVRRESLHNTFGMVRNDGRRPHQGWDLAAPAWTPVYAIADGTIRDVRGDGDYGTQFSLEFEHGGRTLYAFYAHLSACNCAAGEQVSEGDLLGFTGTTGNAASFRGDDEHLHFEIRTQRHPGRGLPGRIDPGDVLGYRVYTCAP
jgi:murein DD-endopeptidase MepM/ murein hydrolase activator NlpD